MNTEGRPPLSVITLNVNELNFPQQHKLRNWIKKKKKNDSTICCLKETDFAAKDTKEVKVIGKKKIFHVNCQKRPDVATLTLDITNFNLRTVIQYYKGHIYW